MYSSMPRAVVAAIVRPSLRAGAGARFAVRAAAATPLLPQSALLSSRNSLLRSFHTSPSTCKGIFPDSADPAAPNPQSHNVAGGAAHVSEPSPLTDGQYHDYAEHYLNTVLEEVESRQEEGSEIEAEYSAGVMNVTVPGVGVYVLNKQPPNKQIWLSSPISGPKRFDWVIEGDQMHEKQESRPFVNGQWIYLRDGTNLTDLLNHELTLNLPEDIYSELD
ncbi:frataxin family protein [Aspergillus saccharolyticus JOP 1030-1]|uniref:ferroxidase n=1 Tax=Aspergillus saccharolyticus JOP 1030-1 TaxID=1450539 RepID=A0A318ZCN5_9EURO|nr:Frataxin [Aspergillus saccharolyticus JOP 1030-1]PYH45226.1 Frataxin [Aspergillus saccharolyticus JOP 1030-1]